MKNTEMNTFEYCSEELLGSQKSEDPDGRASKERPDFFKRIRKNQKKLKDILKECEERKEREEFSPSRPTRRKCKQKKQIPCKELVKETVCVFCLGSLYKGGYIHELYEKTPLIKKQSELNGDDIAWRIGIRTRITVHKKCFNAYVDPTPCEEAEEAEVVVSDLEDSETEGKDSLTCEMEAEKKDQEGKMEENYPQQFVGGAKTSNQVTGHSWEHFRKRNFCLRSYKLPPIPTGEIFSLQQY